MNNLNIGRKIIADDSLVLNLDASNPKSYPGSGNIWTDLTFSNNNGTLINNPTFDPLYGGGFIFDGTDDYIDTTNLSNLSPSSSFSLSIWTDGGNGYALNSFVLDGFSNFSGVALNINAGTIDFSFSDGTLSSFNLNITSITPIIASIYNYVVTYDGSNNTSGMKAYINGLNSTTTNPYNFPLTQSPSYNIPWTIGTVFQDVPPLTPFIFYSGTIFITQIYNKVLTQNEITQNYNALKGRFGIF